MAFIQIIPGAKLLELTYIMHLLKQAAQLDPEQIYISWVGFIFMNSGFETSQ